MDDSYTTIPVENIEDNRLLFCPVCGGMTSHEVEWLVSPLTWEYEKCVEKEIREIRQLRDALQRQHLDIATVDNYRGVTFNSCSVCYHLIVDLCEREEKGPFKVIRLYPKELDHQLPKLNPDMPEKCVSIYKEAAGVFATSPRASAGLMRLCLQQFCHELEVRGKTLDEQIGELVKSGVPEFIQQYMDVCRCVGNSSVHPNVEIDVNEDPDVAKGLFTAMNIIVENLVSIPKRAREAYSALPANLRKHVAERDKK